MCAGISPQRVSAHHVPVEATKRMLDPWSGVGCHVGAGNLPTPHGLQTCPTTSGLYMGTWDPDASPYACMDGRHFY